MKRKLIPRLLIAAMSMLLVTPLTAQLGKIRRVADKVARAKAAASEILGKAGSAPELGEPAPRVPESEASAVTLPGSCAASAHLIGMPRIEDGSPKLWLGDDLVHREPRFDVLDEDGAIWGGLLASQLLDGQRVFQPKWFRWTAEAVTTTLGSEPRLGLSGIIGPGEWHARRTEGGFEILHGGFEKPLVSVLRTGDGLPDDPETKLTKLKLQLEAWNRRGWAVVYAEGQVPGLGRGRFNGLLYLLPSGKIVSSRTIKRFCESASLTFTGTEPWSLCPEGLVIWGVEKADSTSMPAHVVLGDDGEVSCVDVDTHGFSRNELKRLLTGSSLREQRATDSQGWLWLEGLEGGLSRNLRIGISLRGEILTKNMDSLIQVAHEQEAEVARTGAGFGLENLAAVRSPADFLALTHLRWSQGNVRSREDRVRIREQRRLLFIQDSTVEREVDLKAAYGEAIPGVVAMQIAGDWYSFMGLGERGVLLSCPVSEKKLDRPLRGTGLFSVTSEGIQPVLVPGMSVDSPVLGARRILGFEVLRKSPDCRYVLVAAQIGDSATGTRRPTFYLRLELPTLPSM